jgi:hypothetical protein
MVSAPVSSRIISGQPCSVVARGGFASVRKHTHPQAAVNSTKPTRLRVLNAFGVDGFGGRVLADAVRFMLRFNDSSETDPLGKSFDPFLDWLNVWERIPPMKKFAR